MAKPIEWIRKRENGKQRENTIENNGMKERKDKEYLPISKARIVSLARQSEF